MRVCCAGPAPGAATGLSSPLGKPTALRLALGAGASLALPANRSLDPFGERFENQHFSVPS